MGIAGQSYVGADIIGETEDYRLKNSFPDGDFNRDGSVNNADYQVWLNSFGQTGSGLPADGNHNGIVDSADYSIWRDHMAWFGPGQVPAYPARWRDIGIVRCVIRRSNTSAPWPADGIGIADRDVAWLS